jgi:hypothetical protein
MGDALHKILAGNPGTRRELVAAGIFVAVWFAIDVIQFADWAVQKFKSPTTIDFPTAKCTPIPGTNSCWAPALGYYCDSHGCSIPLTQNN